MVTVIKTERKSDVLTPSSLACLSGIPSVNLTLGCAHNCIYCYARGYSVYPGDGKVALYENIPEKLERELSRKKKVPQFVYFSPSSDIFQPVDEALELSHKVLDILLSKGIGVAFLSKGKIPEKTFRLIEKYADNIRSQIGLITADDSLRRIVEPDAAPVDVRLIQMKRLIDGGIRAEARIIPVIPGLTDTDESLKKLLKLISDTGIKRASVSTLFLRSIITRNIRRHIQDSSLIKNILSHYTSERIPVHATHSSIIPLPYPLRVSLYDKVRRIAGEYGIEISICGCMNPDIGGTCNIRGTWLKVKENSIQKELFQEIE